MNALSEPPAIRLSFLGWRGPVIPGGVKGPLGHFFKEGIQGTLPPPGMTVPRVTSAGGPNVLASSWVRPTWASSLVPARVFNSHIQGSPHAFLPVVIMVRVVEVNPTHRQAVRWLPLEVLDVARGGEVNSPSRGKR